MTDDRQASSLEIRPLRTAAERYDVAILGGGLAGLTLAIQLKRQRPDTSVAVLEKREGRAACGLQGGRVHGSCGRPLLRLGRGHGGPSEEEQLVKCGLRFFMPADNNEDITKRVEHGPDRFLPHDNYQIDRGAVREQARHPRPWARCGRASGVPGPGRELRRRPSRGLLHPNGHRRVNQRPLVGRRRRAGQSPEAQARAGKGRRPHHQLRVVPSRRRARHRGFRPRQRGVDGQDVRARHPPVQHQPPAGKGYWVWLIPLSSGPISIGVCADPRVHPFEEISKLDRMVDWLKRHEPRSATRSSPAWATSRTSSGCGISPMGWSASTHPIAGRWSARPAPSPTRSTRLALTSSGSGTSSPAT